MEFIEHHTGHALQGGIRLEPAQEQATGEDFDAGGGRGARLQTHGVPHPLAQGFTQLRCEPLGRSFGRQAAGFEHPDAAACKTRGIQLLAEGQGHPGGFPCPGGCL